VTLSKKYSDSEITFPLHKNTPSFDGHRSKMLNRLIKAGKKHSSQFSPTVYLQFPERHNPLTAARMVDESATHTTVSAI